ncbi:MAG: DUF3048 domain-containing protein [Acidimicrobiia bacterium]
MSRIFLLFGAFALVASACSGDTATTTTTSSSTTTTSTPPTTTPSTTTTSTMPASTTTTIYVEGTTVTTNPPGFSSPVNGLPAEEEIKLDRRAIGVKIDNRPEGRPQSGVMDADSVIELRVEGGYTRFLAIFHDNDSEYLGPVRSVRPTDSTVLAAIGAPLAMSGGQPWVQAVHTSRGVGLIGPGAANLFRISSRVAPFNLYGNTADMRAGADSLEFDNDPPTSLYPIVEWEFPEAIAHQIVLDWSDTVTVTWDWDGEVYRRTHNGEDHVVVDQKGNLERITAEVLVVLGAEFYTQFPPPSDSDWQAVPALDTAGSGRAWVFARGRIWQGTWQRAQYADEFKLLNSDGTQTGVPAGFSWVSIFPDHRSVDWS